MGKGIEATQQADRLKPVKGGRVSLTLVYVHIVSDQKALNVAAGIHCLMTSAVSP